MKIHLEIKLEVEPTNGLIHYTKIARSRASKLCYLIFSDSSWGNARLKYELKLNKGIKDEAVVTTTQSPRKNKIFENVQM
jgi:hypothetical protein